MGLPSPYVPSPRPMRADPDPEQLQSLESVIHGLCSLHQLLSTVEEVDGKPIGGIHRRLGLRPSAE